MEMEWTIHWAMKAGKNGVLVHSLIAKEVEEFEGGFHHLDRTRTKRGGVNKGSRRPVEGICVTR